MRTNEYQVLRECEPASFSRDSRGHTITLGKNVVVTETSYQRLQELSFNYRQRA